jgi:superfamily II DNA or RNA helicase
MEPSSNVHSVPRRKTLREGQERVVRAAVDRNGGLLTAQLPTGYGKTLAAAATYTALRESGAVNRLLYIVPTRAQLNQFTADGAGDFADAGLAGVSPFNIGYSEALALKKHRQNRAEVFACTIQAVSNGGVGTAVREMMTTGRWMVVVDEYHHYGIERAWGRAVLELNSTFTLAMSATPWREGDDSAFGQPEIRVKYRPAAEKEDAVKQLELHAYEYRVDAVAVNGEVISFTTGEITSEAGGDGDAVDKYIAERKMRWSPKYISPLVSKPLERLLNRRVRGVPAQAIIGAMGCLHAKMVCEQVQSMFGWKPDGLRIDWVGTGPHGRTDQENAAILKAFCPPKRADGRRHPDDIKLDVLVHVGIAGEGLDSVFVSEVIHLNPASISNQNDQENGRAARRIPGAPEEMQVACINVDSASPYAEWSGRRVMDVFDRDRDNPEPPEEEENETTAREEAELPDEPSVYIVECELQRIDKGDPEVKGCAEAIAKAASMSLSVMDDPNHPIWDRALELRRLELRERSAGMDEMSRLAQLRQQLSSAVGKVSSLAARTSSTGRFEKSLIADMIRRINTQIKRRFGGGVDQADEQGLRERYGWVKGLEKLIRTEGVPAWLR